MTKKEIRNKLLKLKPGDKVQINGHKITNLDTILYRVESPYNTCVIYTSFKCLDEIVDAVYDIDKEIERILR